MGRFLLVFLPLLRMRGQILWGVDGDGRLVGQADRTLEFLGDKAGVDTDVVRAVRFAESDLVIHQFQFHLYPIGGEVHQVALLVGGQFIAGHFLAVHRHHRPVALDGGLGLALPENPGYKSQKGQDKDQVAFFDKCTLGHTILPKQMKLVPSYPPGGENARPGDG